MRSILGNLATHLPSFILDFLSTFEFLLPFFVVVGLKLYFILTSHKHTHTYTLSQTTTRVLTIFNTTAQPLVSIYRSVFSLLLLLPSALRLFALCPFPLFSRWKDGRRRRRRRWRPQQLFTIFIFWIRLSEKLIKSVRQQAVTMAAAATNKNCGRVDDERLQRHCVCLCRWSTLVALSHH